MLTLHRRCWKLQSAALEGKQTGVSFPMETVYLQRSPRQSWTLRLGRGQASEDKVICLPSETPPGQHD